jgi:predicted dehydrogenase
MYEYLFGHGEGMKKLRIGLVGLGKIARDQHLPALAANADYDLVAIASRNATLVAASIRRAGRSRPGCMS